MREGVSSADLKVEAVCGDGEVGLVTEDWAGVWGKRDVAEV